MSIQISQTSNLSKTNNIYLCDLNRNEVLIFVFLSISMFILGLNSSIITNLTNLPIQTIENIIINKL